MNETSTTRTTDDRTYYGRPVVARPVWEPTVAVYFFTGGLAGAAAGLGVLARLRGRHRLARSCTLTALAGSVVSPVLLIEDLGRRERFHHMLRVFKVTSPMSVGTWVLAAFGSLSGAAAASEVTGVGRRWGRAAEIGSAALGLPRWEQWSLPVECKWPPTPRRSARGRLSWNPRPRALPRLCPRSTCRRRPWACW